MPETTLEEKTQPWTDPFGIWKSKPAFFTWVRGQLRRSWTHYPISKGFKNSLCRPNRGELPSRLVKSVGNCARCTKVFAKSKLEVDHIIPAGSIQKWEDLASFVERLFTTSENLRLVCKDCHKIITLAERFECSEQEASLRIHGIEFGKRKPDDQRSYLGGLGCHTSHLRTGASRRSAFEHHLRTGEWPAVRETDLGEPTGGPGENPPRVKRVRRRRDPDLHA